MGRVCRIAGGVEISQDYGKNGAWRLIIVNPRLFWTMEEIRELRDALTEELRRAR